MFQIVELAYINILLPILSNYFKDYNVNKTMTIEDNKESNNTSLGNTFLKANKINRDGKDTLYNSKKNSLLYTPINPNAKRSLYGSNTINADQSDNLINSVRKIFLYNSKIKI